MLGSCGKKENKVNSANPVNGVPVGSNPFDNALGGTPNFLAQVQSLRSSVTCLSGRTRLATDVSFYVSGGAISGTKIGGQWQPGFMNNGTISNLYIGVSAFRDLMFVTKVTNGGQVVGYNVTLSFCEVPNAYPNFPPLVSNDRVLSNFQAPSGIILDNDTYCGYGVVDAAFQTSIISQRSLTNQYTDNFPVITSFTKPTCNGKF
jgi:hypothetical protein